MLDFGKHLGTIEQLANHLFKSGLLFWLGVLAVWFWCSNSWQLSYTELWKLFISNTEELSKLNSLQTSSIALAIFLIVAAMANLMKSTELFVLRFLEGYYFPFKTSWLKWQNRSIEKMNEQFQELYREQEQNSLNTKKTEKLLQLEGELKYIPELIEQRMPTRLGNLLRKMELYPQERYGLNVFVCWPHLWLLMPENAKNEISNARIHLNNLAQLWMSGAFFMLFTFWAWWASIVSLVTMLFAYRFIYSAAITYGKLVQASFDLYRSLLYQKLRFPLPENPDKERKLGKEITKYLATGLSNSTLEFANTT